MENTKKLKLIEMMMNMSRQGKHQEALDLNKILGIEYHCLIDLGKSMGINGEYHDVYESGSQNIYLGRIFIKNYTDEEIEQAREEERVEREVWEEDRHIYEEEFKQY